MLDGRKVASASSGAHPVGVSALLLMMLMMARIRPLARIAETADDYSKTAQGSREGTQIRVSKARGGFSRPFSPGH